MPQYRKKPVVIEAIQFDFAPATADRIVEMKGDIEGLLFDERGLTITTLEGDMLAQDGDYVIKGVKGELYPCKPDIFYATYESAEVPGDCRAGDDFEPIAHMAMKKDY
jgi:hypothetical protein